MRVAHWVVAPLLLVAADARAQVPSKVHAFSPSSFREREEEAMDLQAMKGPRPVERPGPWTLYGRLGVVNFQNRPDHDGGGLRFDWRRTGPGLGGKIYVGIQRRF